MHKRELGEGKISIVAIATTIIVIVTIIVITTVAIVLVVAGLIIIITVIDSIISGCIKAIAIKYSTINLKLAKSTKVSQPIIITS